MHGAPAQSLLGTSWAIYLYLHHGHISIFEASRILIVGSQSLKHLPSRKSLNLNNIVAGAKSPDPTITFQAGLDGIAGVDRKGGSCLLLDQIQYYCHSSAGFQEGSPTLQSLLGNSGIEMEAFYMQSRCSIAELQSFLERSFSLSF